MENEEIKSKIDKIIKSNLDLDEDCDYNENMTLTDFGADSLDIADIISDIQNEFDIELCTRNEFEIDIDPGLHYDDTIEDIYKRVINKIEFESKYSEL